MVEEAEALAIQGRLLVITEVQGEEVVRAIMVPRRWVVYRTRLPMRTVGVRSATVEASGHINRRREVPKITMGVVAVVRGILAEQGYT